MTRFRAWLAWSILQCAKRRQREARATQALSLPDSFAYQSAELTIALARLWLDIADAISPITGGAR